jgi:hypothetical protein
VRSLEAIRSLRVLSALVAMGSFSATADDDPIIILGDAPSVATNGVVRFNHSVTSDDDPIIIIEEGAPPPPVETVRGPLGRLWETWYLGADVTLLGSVQSVDPTDGVGRLLGDAFVESKLLPTDNLSFEATALARVTVDLTPTTQVQGFADWYEASAKIRVRELASVRIGRLVIPWGATRGVALADFNQPNDHRRGQPFPEPARGKQPQWGAQMKGALGPVGLDTVLWAGFEPSEGSLAASNQGGVRLGRYQTALVRSPARALGWLRQDDVQSLYPDLSLGAFSWSGRASGRIGSIDVSSSVSFGYDATPALKLSPAASRVVANEAFAAWSAPSVEVPSDCREAAALTCLGALGDVLVPQRRAAVAMDAAYSVVGLAIVRAELMAVPQLGNVGKTAWLVDENGVRSHSLTQLAATVALEGQWGDAVDGSVELFNVAWAGVPAGANLWGVESLASRGRATNTERVVNRLAGAAVLGGTLLEERLRWRVRGEAGVLEPDVLMSAELRYSLPVWNLYVGGRGDVFAGVPGTPGWMRQDASLLGVFVGEGA